jgi:DNA-binding Lrp family transcriptional regulator
MQEIDQRDRELLSMLQVEVPLASTPYAILGQHLDMSEKEVIKRAERLKRESVLRQISAVFDARALGYQTSLVAARVREETMDRAAAVVNMHPGVSQNYRRNHDFNLWFTLTVPPNSRFGLQRTVDLLGDEAQWDAARLLPTLKLYKSSDGEAADSSQPADVSFTPHEIEMIRLLQSDLPLQPRPFDVLSRSTGQDPDELLAFAKQLRRNQQMRRFAALVQQRKAFSATAMGVWAVPADREDAIGAQMAAHKAVAQCYLRPVYPDWPYNIFTTVHGRSVDECESVLQDIASETGIHEMRALFPIKEFKRSRIAYFSTDVDAWEQNRSGQASASA